jgi:hypothetical protein
MGEDELLETGSESLKILQQEAVYQQDSSENLRIFFVSEDQPSTIPVKMCFEMCEFWGVRHYCSPPPPGIEAPRAWQVPDHPAKNKLDPKKDNLGFAMSCKARPGLAPP